MNHEPKAGPGLDPERLAAYIDRRLSPEDRAAVEAQLAADPDSYAVLVETLKAIDSVPGVRTVPEVPRGRVPKVRWAIAGGLLAAAAALVLVVRAQPEWWVSLRGGDPRFERLVAAVGEARYTEARLSGGFKYGPIRQVTRSADDLSQQNLGLLAVAGELQKDADFDASAANLHAWGVAELLLGRDDAAIGNLERAAVLAADRHDINSDLAAAYLSRARGQNQAADLMQALNATKRALAIEPASSEALFNHALILQSLHLREQAKAAWRLFLQSDPGSPWAGDARDQLRTLEQAPDGSAWDRDRSELLSSASDTILRDIVRRHPQRVRELVEDELLPGWGRLVSDANPVAAGQLEQARRLAQSLEEVGGDSLAARAVAEILTSSIDRQRRIAAALVSYGEGRQKFESEQVAASEADFLAAEQALTAAGHPMQYPARLSAAQAGYFKGDITGLLSRAGSILEQLPAIGAPKALRGRTRWAVGLAHGVRGDFVTALGLYQAALIDFEEAGETENQANVHSLIAEAYAYLGDPMLAANERLQALAAVPVMRTARRRQAILIGASALAERQGLPGAAADFASAAVDYAEADSRPATLVEVLARRARLSALAGRTDDAKRDVARARQLLGTVGQTGLGERLQAEVLDAELQIAAEDRVDSDAGQRAIEIFEARQSSARTARLWLAAGRAKLRRGDTIAAVEAFRSGLENRAGTKNPIAATLADSLADEADALASELAFALTGQNQLDAAADTLLRARRAPASAANAAIDRSHLSPSTAVLVVAAGDHGTRTWLLRAGESRAAYQNELPAPLLEVAAARCRESQTLAELRDRCAILFDRLIAPFQSNLDGVTQLVISVPPMIHDVPFAALWDSTRSRFMVEEYEVAVLASGDSALGLQRPWTKPETMLAIGDPAFDEVTNAGLKRLPASAKEARDVAALYERAVHLDGSSATRDAILQSIRGVDVVHFAGHSTWNPAYPGLSRLVVSGVGSAGFIFAHDLLTGGARSAAVVVLASCGSAIGARRSAVGPFGLPAAFLFSGSRVVIAATREVPDDDTRRFSLALHAKLAAGVPPVEALTAVQREALSRAVAATALSFQAYQ